MVKHAGANEVRLRVPILARGMQIVIEDNGCGFGLGQLSPFGNGLINMRKRMEEVDGSLKVDSALGKGTKLTVDIVPSDVP